MRRLFSCFPAGLLLVALAGTTGSVAWAEPPAPRPTADAAPAAASTVPQDPESVLERGLDLERARNWAGAIETYHAALERWPSRVDFSRRLRLCEIHFKLSRRYLDTSFRNVLLRLPHEQAVDLYDEVVERIQTNYVDPVPLEPLVRHGLDNLEVALRDPVFVKTNAPAATPERVAWLRDTLRQYRAELNVPDRAAAIRLALASSEAARQAIGMAVDAGLAGIRLRRLRRPRRFHQLPDPRQARRPVRDDRRQLRRPGGRAQDRQGGPASWSA